MISPTSTPDRAQLGTSPRFKSLDGYRALAALSVVFYHVLSKFRFQYDHDYLGPAVARLGNYGVTVFFLLSGFLLYRPFAIAHLKGERAPSVRRFYTRRLLRIIPAYWVALFFVFFVFSYRTAYGWDGYLTYFGFGQIYRAHGYAIGGLGQAWSLCVEMSFYLMLPLIAWGIRQLWWGRPPDLKGRLRSQLYGVGILYVIAVLYRLWALEIGDGLPNPAYWLPGFLDLFALGMLLATASAWLAVGGRLPEVVDHVRSRPWLCLLFTIQLYWVLSVLHAPLGFEFEGTGQLMGRITFAGLAAFAFLIPGTIGTTETDALSRFLASNVMVALGTISYGIYLWHTQFIELTLNMRDSRQIDDNVWIVLAIVLVLTIGAAAVSYWVVERPFLRLARRSRVQDKSIPQEVELAGGRVAVSAMN